jgi:adenylate kinase
MRLVLLGAPGAGKGTQAVEIAKAFKIPQISTGDIFRYNIKNSTELGRRAKEYIDKGLLVPDQITVDIVDDRLKQSDCENGFVLDGFPRTIEQAKELDGILSGIGVGLDCVLNIHVNDDDIIKRMSGRRICSKCGMSYHKLYNPTTAENTCDQCGAEVIQRDDDREEIVLQRLKTYHIQTEPLIEYYKGMGKLITVYGYQKIEDTSNAVLKALNGV